MITFFFLKRQREREREQKIIYFFLYYINKFDETKLVYLGKFIPHKLRIRKVRECHYTHNIIFSVNVDQKIQNGVKIRDPFFFQNFFLLLCFHTHTHTHIQKEKNWHPTISYCLCIRCGEGWRQRDLPIIKIK